MASNLLKTYKRIASWYDFLDSPWEFFRYRFLRPLVFNRIGKGTLLDAGAGTGRNIAYYPAGVSATALDQSLEMLVLAKKRAYRLQREVHFVPADVTQPLPFQDASFDYIVATFLFCVLPDEFQRQALPELYRLLKPGGTMMLLEYTYSKKLLNRVIMKLMSPWVEWAFGARFDRKTSEIIQELGLPLKRREYLHQDSILLLTLEK